VRPISPTLRDCRRPRRLPRTLVLRSKPDRGFALPGLGAPTRRPRGARPGSPDGRAVLASIRYAVVEEPRGFAGPGPGRFVWAASPLTPGRRLPRPRCLASRPLAVLPSSPSAAAAAVSFPHPSMRSSHLGTMLTRAAWRWWRSRRPTGDSPSAELDPHPPHTRISSSGRPPGISKPPSAPPRPADRSGEMRRSSLPARS